MALVLAPARCAAPRSAIVVQDQARCAPRRATRRQQQAVLWQGEAVEVRGERMDYLQVYDHRRERGGLRARQPGAPHRAHAAGGARAARGRALPARHAGRRGARHRLRRGLPAGGAGRGAQRRSRRRGARRARHASPTGWRGAPRPARRRRKAAQAALSAHLDVARALRRQLRRRIERDGRMQICYDGDAFRRVLAMRSTRRSSARARRSP